MYIFGSLALAGFIYLISSFLFGHDHDGDHSIDHGHDGEHDDNGDHSEEESTISIFSGKVVAMFIMTFGGTGGVCRFYDWSYPACSLAGVGAGVVLGLAMWGLLSLIYKQQCSSNIKTSSIVGKSANVTIGIDANKAGEIGVDTEHGYMNYIARSQNNQAIAKGTKVTIVASTGSTVFVQ